MCRPVVDLFRHGVVAVPLLSCAHVPHSAILAKRGHPCTLCITSAHVAAIALTPLTTHPHTQAELVRSPVRG